VDPNDVGSRANLGLTYALGGRYDDAGRVADQLLNQYRENLSDFGQSVALKTKAFALEGLGDYNNAANYFRQALEKIGNDDDLSLRMRYLLALAKTKNVARFEEGTAFCNRSPGALFARRPYYVDSLRAYVLAANNQEAQAAQVVEKWRHKGDIRRTVVDYWSKVPHATDVVNTWSRFMERQEEGREIDLDSFRVNH
jgi:tetratricopeptide (TPR) repeat protein